MNLKIRYQIYFVVGLFFFISCNDKNEKQESSEIVINDSINSIDNDKKIAVALEFINSYISDCNKMNQSVGCFEFVNSSQLASENFKKELKNILDKADDNDPEMGLGFDPILVGQDYPSNGFEFDSYLNQDNFIQFKGVDWTDFKVTVKVIQNGNEWLVDGCGLVNIPQDMQTKL